MVTLVVGGSASGKSDIAESVAMKSGKDSLGGKSDIAESIAVETGNSATVKKLYIATMQPFDEECVRRIEKHRLARAEKGFDTLEIYSGFAKVSIPPTDTVLIECMSNLLANEMYGGGFENRSSEDVISDILTGLARVKSSAETVVIVSNEVFCDGCKTDSETLRYIDCLGKLNAVIAEKADVVIEAVCGIEIFHKGGKI